MKLATLFTINFPIAIFFGLTCALIPGMVLQLYGLPADDAAIWTTRLVGGSILGFATLMWFGRKSPNFDARRAIALALLVQDIIGFGASLEIQMSGSINALGWFNLILYGGLGLAYAYFLFLRPTNT
jgi:hypothetical protein